ncbi:MAG: hypothetical protein JST00_37015 [Deltaproteobacteria bacterium]|nr:hypothetical protein [Deltaproteobacteria bacterium]
MMASREVITVRRLALALCFTALPFAWSCSKATGQYSEDPDAATLTDGGTFVPQDGNVVTPAACSEDNKDIYVIAEDRSFYLFHPPTLEFKSKGILACPTGGAQATSMAVDRAGFAWVRHSDGSVWKVNTKDLSCTPTNYVPQSESFLKFGMGFATETKGGSTEQLYVSDSDGAGLAKIDTKSHALTFIGPYTGALAGTTSELTGTGDGKLYGFFVTQPAQVAEISKATGDIISAKELPGVYAGDAWAFSFYGGDFYIYTNTPVGGLPQNQTGSDVTRYRPSDGSIQVVKKALGFKIVGAGVSTCAPTTMPR